MSRLSIHRACYRSEGKSVDVTGKLASFIENDALVLHGDFAAKLGVAGVCPEGDLEVDYVIDDGARSTLVVGPKVPLYICCPVSAATAAASSSSSSSSLAASTQDHDALTLANAFPDPAEISLDAGDCWQISDVPCAFEALRIAVTSPDVVSLKNVFLMPRADLPVGDASPIPYYATVENALLKQSKKQDQFTSQDPFAGKYAAQNLCRSPTAKSRLHATRARGAASVGLVLRPAHGTPVFPRIATIHLLDAPSSLQLRVEGKPQGAAGWVPLAHEGSSGVINVGTNVRLFSPTERLLQLIRAGDRAAVLQAFNRMPPQLCSHVLSPDALTGLLRAVVAPPSADMFAVLLSQIENRPMIFDEALQLLFTAWSAADAAALAPLLAMVISNGPKLSLQQVAGALALGKTEVVDELFRLERAYFADYQEELLQAALPVNFSFFTYVVKKIQQAAAPEEKALRTLPSIPALVNPSPATLLSAYRCADRTAFDELARVSSRHAFSAFFNEMFVRSPGDCSAELLRTGFDKALNLTAAVKANANVADVLVSTHQHELAAQLFAHGARCYTGNSAAVLHAFQRSDEATFDFLEAQGCPVPLFHLFCTLVQNIDMSEETTDRALKILFARNRLQPDSVLPSDGVSLMKMALKLQNFPLASRLMANGATLPVTDGPSIFAKAYADGVPARALAAAVEFRSADDAELLKPALLSFVKKCLPGDVDCLRRLLNAVPDLAFDIDGVSPLDAALENSPPDMAVVNALIEAGAPVPRGFAQKIIPEQFETMLYSQYLFIVDKDPEVNYAQLLGSMMQSSPSVLKTVIGKEIVGHALSKQPELSEPVGFGITGSVDGPYVDRFGTCSMSWGYSGSPDAITVTVSQPVTILGIGAYGGSSGDFRVTIECREGTCALSGEVLASAVATFQCSSSEITPILFDAPVTLAEDSPYTMVINYSSTISSYYGQEGVSSVTSNDVTFTFQTPSDGSHNGTSNSSGQIPRLYIQSLSKKADVFEPLPLLAVCALTQKDEALFERLYACGARLPAARPESKRGKILFEKAYQAALKNYTELTTVLSAFFAASKNVGELLRSLQKLPARAQAFTQTLVENFLKDQQDPGRLLAQALQANTDIMASPYGKQIVEYALAHNPDLNAAYPVEGGGDPICVRRLLSTSSSSSNWGYSGTPDSIAFRVSEPVQITGIGAVGGSGNDYAVTISIRDGSTASSPVLGTAVRREFHSSDSTIVPLSFEEPIPVEPDRSYCAVICYESRGNTYSGEGGQTTVTVDDVRFDFTSTSGENNGTSSSSGQIHSLYFTKGVVVGDNPLELPLLAIAAFSQKSGTLFDRLYQAGARNSATAEGLSPENKELRAKLLQKGFKNLLKNGANPIIAFDSFFEPANVKASDFVALCESLPESAGEHIEELAQKFLQTRSDADTAALLFDLMQHDHNILNKPLARQLIEHAAAKKPNLSTRFPYFYTASTSEAKRFSSMSSSNSNWGYGGDADAISFQVSSPVYIYGLTAVGGQGEYACEIELRSGTSSTSGEVLASGRLTFDSHDDSLVPIHFDSPAWVEEDTNYTAVIRVTPSDSGTNSHSGESGSASVTADGVTFRFSSSSGETNGTDVYSGQVHSILFSENASASLALRDGPKKVECELPLLVVAALSQKTPELFQLLTTDGADSVPTASPPSTTSIEAAAAETALVRSALAAVLSATPVAEMGNLIELFERIGYERGNLLLGILSTSVAKLTQNGEDPVELCELLCTLLDSEEIDHSASSSDGDMLSLALKNGFSPDIIAVLLRNGASISAAENFRTLAGRHMGPLLNIVYESYVKHSVGEWMTEVANHLIDAGLQINEAADDHLPTPHFIAWTARKFKDMPDETVAFLAHLKERGLNTSLQLSNYSAPADFQKKFGFSFASTLTPDKFAKGAVKEWFLSQAD